MQNIKLLYLSHICLISVSPAWTVQNYAIFFCKTKSRSHSFATKNRLLVPVRAGRVVEWRGKHDVYDFYCNQRRPASVITCFYCSLHLFWMDADCIPVIRGRNWISVLTVFIGQQQCRPTALQFFCLWVKKDDPVSLIDAAFAWLRQKFCGTSRNRLILI